MKVYAISGHAQNGKDTIAQMMYDKFTQRGETAIVMHYADLLKYICKTYFDWDGKKDERGRHILQYVGTDVVRQKEPDYWVDFIISIMTLFDGTWDNVLIPDSRFPNEIDKLKTSGFDVKHIRVVRPNYESPLTPEQQKHPSETALDDVEPDFTIVNIGDMSDLDTLITNFMEEYIYEHRD